MRIVLAIGEIDLQLAIQLMLSELPGIKIIGSASDYESFTALVKSSRPDIALLDWELMGDEIGSIIHETNPLESETKTILIAMGKEHSEREAVLQAGADEYVVIGDPPEKLLQVFHQLNVL